jgi:hypothetical protein
MNDPDKFPPEREYDRSGFYTEEGKSFRIWALLAWLSGTIVVLAAISALLNFILL